MNRIVELSSLVARETAGLDEFFVKNKLPTPSVDSDALWSIPMPETATDMEASRVAVIEACPELKALMTGPKALLRSKVSETSPYIQNSSWESQWTAYAGVKAIRRPKLGKSFPVGESAPFEAMSSFLGPECQECAAHCQTRHYQSSVLPREHAGCHHPLRPHGRFSRRRLHAKLSRRRRARWVLAGRCRGNTDEGVVSWRANNLVGWPTLWRSG